MTVLVASDRVLFDERIDLRFEHRGQHLTNSFSHDLVQRFRTLGFDHRFDYLLFLIHDVSFPASLQLGFFLSPSGYATFRSAAETQLLAITRRLRRNGARLRLDSG